jgi:hypothetical protein
MNLLQAYVHRCHELDLFSQKRTQVRATRLLLCNLLCLGRKWITRIICMANRDQCDWSADYKLFSRSPWRSQDLFTPVVRNSLDYFDPAEPIIIAGDETKCKRAGNKVKRSRWVRDPLSPPFHVNFIKGIRFVQFSVLLPLHRIAAVGARAVPLSFEPVDQPTKPGKKASDQEKAAYLKACKKNNMCQQAVRQINALRRQYDMIGAAARLLLFVMDGGFCNRTVFRAPRKGACILVRCRKDAKLCLPANDPTQPRRIYAKEKFTPEDVRTNDSAWQKDHFFIGDKWRPVRFKQISSVLWQGGAGNMPLRLIVIAPIPYRLSFHSRAFYRRPAYFLCDNLDLPLETLIQATIDRWQIEVNHRDEKQHIGLQHPQVWNERSVDRLPAFMVASYSFLLLASLQAYGARRSDQYLRPAKWQRNRLRPSCLDLISLLRKQAFSHPELLRSLNIDISADQAAIKAAA